MADERDQRIMQPKAPIGFVGFGAYIPRYRLPAKEVARIWKGGAGGTPIDEKAVAGLDEDVIEFLQLQSEVQEMMDHIEGFLQNWIPRFKQQNRCYLTVSIGCTGGQHRSVFIAQQLYDNFRDSSDNVTIRHREML